MEILIRAKSRSNPDEPYEVRFSFDEDSATVFCDCPAGEWSKLCKHKVELVKGNAKMLHDESDAKVLAEIQSRLVETSVLDYVMEYEKKKKDIEKRQAMLKKELANERGKLERLLSAGC